MPVGQAYRKLWGRKKKDQVPDLMKFCVYQYIDPQVCIYMVIYTQMPTMECVQL